MKNNYKKNVSIICLSPNFGGMEIDAIKLANKLSSYSKIILVAKENGFIAQKFDNNCLNNQNISLETVKFKSSLSFSLLITFVYFHNSFCSRFGFASVSCNGIGHTYSISPR